MKRNKLWMRVASCMNVTDRMLSKGSWMEVHRLYKSIYRKLRSRQISPSIHPKEPEAGAQTDIGTPTLTVALLTITKTWKQVRCPSADD